MIHITLNNYVACESLTRFCGRLSLVPFNNRQSMLGILH